MLLVLWEWPGRRRWFDWECYSSLSTVSALVFDVNRLVAWQMRAGPLVLLKFRPM